MTHINQHKTHTLKAWAEALNSRETDQFNYDLWVEERLKDAPNKPRAPKVRSIRNAASLNKLSLLMRKGCTAEEIAGVLDFGVETVRKAMNKIGRPLTVKEATTIRSALKLFACAKRRKPTKAQDSETEMTVEEIEALADRIDLASVVLK